VAAGNWKSETKIEQLLYLTNLYRLDIAARSFAENAGEFAELLQG
jgi:hypothetical protein